MTIKNKNKRIKQYSIRLTLFKGHLWFNIFKLSGRLQFEFGLRIGKEW